MLISKKLFGFGLKAPSIVLHFFCSGLMVILIGVHLGLHWAYLKGALAKRLPGLRLPAGAAAVLCLALCAFGVSGLFTSSLGSWLARPFVAYEGHGGSETAAAGKAVTESYSHGTAGEGETAAEGSSRDAAGDEHSRAGGAQEDGEQGEGGHGQQAFSLTRLLGHILTYFSIFFLIGKAVHLLDQFLTKNGRTAR